MSQATETIVERIRILQEELEEHFEERRQKFSFRLKRGRVIFDAEVKARQRQFRVGVSTYLKNPNWPVILTAPFIFALIIPLVLLDIFMAIYQFTCFPVYGINRVRRADFLAIDRHHLAYLNGLDKLNCIYCGYATGLLAMAGEIASRTEAYWCPIKHSRRLHTTHARYPAFADFGDAQMYRQRLQEMRADLKQTKE